jgi:hypothetical protein
MAGAKNVLEEKEGVYCCVMGRTWQSYYNSAVFIVMDKHFGLAIAERNIICQVWMYDQHKQFFYLFRNFGWFKCVNGRWNR